MSPCPKEELLRNGPAGLADCELLAIFLMDLPMRDARKKAHNALVETGGLRRLLDLPREELHILPGFDELHHVLLQAALEIGRRHLASALDRGAPMESPRALARFFTARVRHELVEVFIGLFLDNRHRVIACEELARGTVDGTTVHAREVVRRALHHNAAAVVFGHNHPSGVAEPSHADRNLTGELTAALALVQVRVLDHVIVGEGQVVSFVERGLL